mgnify:CR=1 FL=1
MANVILDNDFQEAGVTENRDFKKLVFPLHFEFKITTLANDFVVKDANGQTLAYVRQKMFKFVEDIQIFTNESKKEQIYNIKADRWIDFNSIYSFFDKNDKLMGSVARKGMKSLWKAQYQIHNNNKELAYHIKEINPWTKVFDALFGEIPILGFFTGYVFNPKYSISDLNENMLVKMKKEPSFFGRKFTIDLVGDLPEQDEEDVMLSLMMFVLLERRRG